MWASCLPHAECFSWLNLVQSRCNTPDCVWGIEGRNAFRNFSVLILSVSSDAFFPTTICIFCLSNQQQSTVIQAKEHFRCSRAGLQSEGGNCKREWKKVISHRTGQAATLHQQKGNAVMVLLLAWFSKTF